MITVVIYINDRPILARSARNQSETTKDGKTIYKVDDGRTLEHLREDGAVELVKQMLEGIKPL